MFDGSNKHLSGVKMWFWNGFGGVFYSFFYIYFSRDQCLHLHPDNEKEVEIIRRWIQMEITNVGSGGVFKTQLNVLNGDFYEANFS